jgi:replicative DNA helicase
MSGATDMLLRVPPHSREGEQSLLGALLLDNRVFDSIPPMQGGDFYAWEHRVIFDAIAGLIRANKPADIITVRERLDREHGSGADDITAEYLNAMAQMVPSASNAATYAQIVGQCALRRRVISLLDNVITDAFAAKGEDAGRALVDKAVTGLMALEDGRTRDEPQDMPPLAAKFMEDLERRADGHTDAISTGLHDLNRLTGEGGRRGELWVIGARPSMGKTAFVLSLCRAVGLNKRVLMLTQEDSLLSLMSRHVAAAGAVNLAHLRNPSNAPDAMWGQVLKGTQELIELQISMDDQSSLKLSDVRRKVQQVRRRHGDCAVVIIDYLQLMDGERDNRNHALGELANGLKNMAKELNCWVVLLSQLNREADKRSGPPQMSDLRDSGDIEGAADLIGLLHREYMRTRKEADKYEAKLHVCKHKNGPTDTLRFYFDGAHQRFGDYAHAGSDEGV